MWATEDGSDTMRSCVVDFRVNFGSTPLGHMLIAGENSCDRKEDYEKSEMESKQKQAAKKFNLLNSEERPLFFQNIPAESTKGGLSLSLSLI